MQSLQNDLKYLLLKDFDLASVFHLGCTSRYWNRYCKIYLAYKLGFNIRPSSTFYKELFEHLKSYVQEYNNDLNWYGSNKNRITYQPDLNVLLKEPIISTVFHLRNLISAIKTLNRWLGLTSCESTVFQKTPESVPLPTYQAIIEQAERVKEWLRLNQEVLLARDVLIVRDHIYKAITEESDDPFEFDFVNLNLHGLNTSQEVIDTANKFGVWCRSNYERLDQLKILSLTHYLRQYIATLPLEVCELTSLEKLDARNELLSNLPDEIGRLLNLRKFNVCGNELGSLPEGMGRLCHLYKLELSHNKLTSLPDCIGKLSQLAKLYLA